MEEPAPRVLGSGASGSSQYCGGEGRVKTTHEQRQKNSVQILKSKPPPRGLLATMDPLPAASPSSVLRDLSLSSPATMKRPDFEKPIRYALAKRRKTLQDDGAKAAEDGEDTACATATATAVVVKESIVVSCSTPPPRSAISQLVNETIASTFASPSKITAPLIFGKRRANSCTPLSPIQVPSDASPAKTAKTTIDEEKTLVRAQSESAMTIKSAVERINSEPKLVGDGSKLHLLPIMEEGKHSDLKEITGKSLVALLEGEYSTEVKSFEIVDCRYPYEFNGGHIVKAVNLHTKRQIYDRFFGDGRGSEDAENEGKRHLVIFHCEFSSQRGPEMCRYVRDCDRRVNEYPNLHYPEIYVLYGGYKLFFHQFKSYCIPQLYLPMLDEDYVDEYRYYKNLSKSQAMKPKSVSGRKEIVKSLRANSTKKLCLDHL